MPYLRLAPWQRVPVLCPHHTGKDRHTLVVASIGVHEGMPVLWLTPEEARTCGLLARGDLARLAEDREACYWNLPVTLACAAHARPLSLGTWTAAALWQRLSDGRVIIPARRQRGRSSRRGRGRPARPTPTAPDAR